MFSFIRGYLNLRKMRSDLYIAELAEIEAEQRLIEIEDKIVALEAPEVQLHLKCEFALQRMFVGLGLKTKTSVECIESARLLAKVFSSSNVPTRQSRTENTVS